MNILTYVRSGRHHDGPAVQTCKPSNQVQEHASTRMYLMCNEINVWVVYIL